MIEIGGLLRRAFRTLIRQRAPAASPDVGTATPPVLAGRPLTSMGMIVVDHMAFHWEERPALRNLFPYADHLLVIRSEAGPTEFRLGVRVLGAGTSDEMFWIGPTFVQSAAPERFPSVEVGRYYRSPAFKGAKACGIHGETVRSIVASLLSGRRLQETDCSGVK